METHDGKDFIFYLVQQQTDCDFSLRAFLQKEGDSWKISYSTLELVKKGSRKPLKYDFGECVFEEQILDLSEGLDIVSNFYPSNEGEKGKLIVPGYDSFELESFNGLRFMPSKYESTHLKRKEWPARFISFRVKQDRIAREWQHRPIKKEVPYYPSAGEAIIDLFNLRHPHFSSFGEGYFVVYDYRARIEYLKLVFSKAEIMIDHPEIEPEDLFLKVFAKAGGRRKTISDIDVTDGLVEVNLGFQPENLSVVLASQKDDFVIDEKIYATWISEREGVLIERPDEEIISLTKAGESQNLEYKSDIPDDRAKNEFIESVIAFLNTNRGLILIGVDDDGKIVGTSRGVNEVQNIIHDSCDPPPAEIKIAKKKIGGKTILSVEVPEGKNKPYQSKRNRQWYVRHNASDMIMERSELMEILEKSQAKPYM